ncbi:hypothetical protein C1645_781119, partial [Glomus cerebriforme]
MKELSYYMRIGIMFLFLEHLQCFMVMNITSYPIVNLDQVMLMFVLFLLTKRMILALLLNLSLLGM